MERHVAREGWPLLRGDIKCIANFVLQNCDRIRARVAAGEGCGV